MKVRKERWSRPLKGFRKGRKVVVKEDAEMVKQLWPEGTIEELLERNASTIVVMSDPIEGGQVGTVIDSWREMPVARVPAIKVLLDDGREVIVPPESVYALREEE